MRFSLFAVLLLSCASPPTTYNQGAFRPPPPPRFSPVEDAPHTFRPGHPVRKPSVEPQPRPKRYLPPEPDGKPGIWASEAPDPEPSIHVLGVPIASPQEPAQRSKTAWCAAQARIAFTANKYAKRDAAWLKCFANVLVKGCLDAEKGNIERRIKADTAQPFDMDRLAAVTKSSEHAARAVARLCPEPTDPETSAGYHAMIGLISRINWGGQ